MYCVTLGGAFGGLPADAPPAGHLRRCGCLKEGLPFLRNPNLGYFLDMLPYLCTVGVLVVVAWYRRQGKAGLLLRRGAPAALGVPFIRGERGR